MGEQVATGGSDAAGTGWGVVERGSEWAGQGKTGRVCCGSEAAGKRCSGLLEGLEQAAERWMHVVAGQHSADIKAAAGGQCIWVLKNIILFVNVYMAVYQRYGLEQGHSV